MKMYRLRMFFAVLMSVMSLPVMSVDFTIDGIQYEQIYNGTGYQVKVLGCLPEVTVANIPDTVCYESIAYRVASISIPYNATVREVVVPEGMTELEANAFANCTALEKVTFPSNSALCKIGDFAFSFSSLKQITLPDAVTKIPNGCFQSCTALEEVNMPSVTEIGEEAFVGCKSLKKISIPDAVTELHTNCFLLCSALEEVVISDNSSLTKLGDSAFSGCVSLKRINIPNSVTEICYYCFENCSGLEEVAISDNSSLATLGSGAFDRCGKLKRINIPDGVKEIPDYCFNSCAALEEASISDNSALTKLDEYAFQKCSSLKKINIPDGVTEISHTCFYLCSALEEVRISANSSLTKIGEQAFNDCSSLKSINIPDGLTEIPNHCFYNCYALEEAHISANSSLTKIDEWAFGVCRSLKSINIPDATTELEEFCLFGCESVVEINISENSLLSKIGRGVFYGCKSLKKIYIPRAVSELSEECFTGCESLEEIVFPVNSTLSKVNKYTFSRCSSLKRIDLPANVTEIPYCCFYSAGLESFIFSENMNSIDANAFDACNSLKSALFLLPTPPTEIIDKLSVTAFIYVLKKYYDAYIAAGVGEYYSLIALDDEQVAAYKENGEVLGLGFNDYLALVDWSDDYNSYSTLQNNYCDELDLIRFIARDAESMAVLATYTDKYKIENGQDRTNSIRKEEGRQYIFEWYYMYNDQLCRKSSSEVVAHPKFYRDKVDYTLTDGKAVVTGCTPDLTAAVIPKTVKFGGEDLNVASVDPNVFEQYKQLKAVVDLNGNVGVESLNTTASIYVADANGNSKLKEFVSWGDSQFMYSGYTHSVLWSNNIEGFGLQATASSGIIDCASLTADMMYVWDGWDQNAKKTASFTGCAYQLGVSSSMPYGDGSVNAYADLSMYARLEITCTEGTPRILLNRDVAEGQCSAVESESHLIDNTNSGCMTWASKYFRQEGNKWIVDLRQLVADKGYAHLHAIKGGNWQNCTVTGMDLFADRVQTVQTEVGEHTDDIVFTFFYNEQTFEVTRPCHYTITPATLTATVEDAERVYGDENPEFTLTLKGFVYGESADVLTSTGEFVTEATKKSPVGEYAVKCSGIKAKNYEVVTVDGVLKVTPAKLMVSMNDATRTYGAPNPEFTVNYTGFRNGDDYTVLTKQPVCTTYTTAKSEVGEYGVIVEGAQAENYVFEYGLGILTITQAPLTVEVQNAQRAYGVDNPEFTAKYTGFVNGETESDLISQGMFVTEATKDSPAGEYAIKLIGVEAKNYKITTIDGLLTIGIAKLMVKVNDAERGYGDENPAFTYTVTGLANGDRIEDVLTSVGSFECSATSTSDVGEYPVTCAGINAGNYAIELVSGVLTVTPAQVIARVDNATRPYGEENPEFAVSYTGWRNGETDGVLTNRETLTTIATKTSDVGEYEITATGAQAKNYVFQYEPGVLTITQAEQQVAWEQTFGDIVQYAQLELTATATSGLPVSYQVTQGSDLCSVVKIGNATYLDCFGTGDVTIAAWQEGDKNYYPTLRIYKEVKVVPTSISSAESVDYTVTTKRGQLLIGGLKEGDTVIVTDLAGRLVYSGDESTVYVARGSYIVRIGKLTWKVLVK